MCAFVQHFFVVVVSVFINFSVGAKAIAYYTRENSFCTTLFQLGMDLKKGEKQGRDERMQEDYPTSAEIHSRCRVVLHSFISSLFLSVFSGPSLTEMKFSRTFFPF